MITAAVPLPTLAACPNERVCGGPRQSGTCEAQGGGTADLYGAKAQGRNWPLRMWEQ